MTTVTENLDTPEVLRRAADLLEREGWCQRRMRRRDGSRCVDKALIDASNREVEWATAVKALAGHLNLPRPGIAAWEAVQTWNDEPYVTKADVLAALRETAEAVTAR